MFSPNTLFIASLCGYAVRGGWRVCCSCAARNWRRPSASAWRRFPRRAACSPGFFSGRRAVGRRWAVGTVAARFLPYLKFTVRLDALGAFFLLIVSLLGLAVSIYSLGYARGYFGRRNVGVLGAFYNALLLATTLLFAADNIWVFLIAWELTALTAFCLVGLRA